MGQEIELKLAVPESRWEELARSPVLSALGAAFGPSRRLAATYYDTRDGKLAADGVAVRVRTDGGRRVQTVKTEGRPGLAPERGEWSTTVPAGLDWTALESTDVKALAKRAAKRDLVPVFETDIARRVARISLDGAAVEAALDSGEVAAGRRRAPVKELELELIDGAPRAIFALARRLVEAHGLRLSTATKAERGRALAARTKILAVKAAPLDLSPDLTAAQGAAAAIDSCVAHAAANLEGIVAARAPEAVHQMRVALRRLRAGLTLFKPVLPEAARERLKAEAGRIAATLGRSRDLDVFLKDTLAPILAKRSDDSDLTTLRRQTAAQRRAAWALAVGTASDPRTQLFLLDAAETALDLRMAAAPEDAPSLSALSRRALSKRLAAASAFGARLDQLAAPERHEMRIALKKLRYAVEFFAGLYRGKRVKAYAKALARLQDAFGAFNDAAMAEAAVAAARDGAAEKARPALDRAGLYLAGWSAHRADRAWDEARDLWTEFAAAEPFWD